MSVSSVSRMLTRGLFSLLILITCVLAANALIGERGLLAALNANHEYRQLSARISTLRNENGALRGEVRLLREEPSRLEELARQELGLIRPGERLFIVPAEPLVVQVVEPSHAERQPDLEHGPQKRGS